LPLALLGGLTSKVMPVVRLKRGGKRCRLL
jgi:hypothetical protein